MYYGTPDKQTGMYSYTLDEAEEQFRDEYLDCDRVATDIGNVKARMDNLALRYETSKLRAAHKGCRFDRDETTQLETGRPHPWDEFNDYLRYGADVRPKYAHLVKSRKGEDILVGGVE